MGPSGFLVIIESQAIMVSTRVAIGKLIHALEVWSDDPRLPNIEPLQHEPSTADSTAIQRCIGQYSARSLCTRGVVLYCNTATIQRLHSTALQRSTLYSALQSPSGQATPIFSILHNSRSHRPAQDSRTRPTPHTPHVRSDAPLEMSASAKGSYQYAARPVHRAA